MQKVHINIISSFYNFLTLGNRWDTKHELLLSGEWWDLLSPWWLGKNHSCWTYHYKVSITVHCHATEIKYPLDVVAFFCHILNLMIILSSGFMYLFSFYVGCLQQGFFFSVLKILGELNSGCPSKVAKDFSMITQRNNNVSMFLFISFCAVQIQFIWSIICIKSTTE